MIRIKSNLLKFKKLIHLKRKSYKILAKKKKLIKLKKFSNKILKLLINNKTNKNLNNSQDILKENLILKRNKLMFIKLCSLASKSV